MKLLAVLFSALLVAGIGCNDVQAQVTFNGNYQLTPVNNGTGAVVSIPLGTTGLSVSVGTGSAALPLQNIAGQPGATQYYMGDDDVVNVPLGFNFPYFGERFNNSWMYSNGFVSFKSGDIPGAGCCSGQNLSTLAANKDTTYSYMIAPLWTDLMDQTGQATWVLKNSTSATYGWYGTYELGTNNQSSFEVNINSNGAANVRYGSAFVSYNTVTAGMTGNLERGEYFQYYHGQGFNIPATNPVSWSLSGTYTYDPCVSNPLSSPTCAGYTAAYTTQQCTISALYDPTCPGYTAAYTTQQCSVNPLYSTACSGYQSAYTSQQCSLDPLYSTTCSGYQQAYTNLQCSLNPLYSTNCAGYASAYLDQQCSINPLYSTTCSGYAAAYHDQQCSINPLFATNCPGYTTAYQDQQCSLNPLYSTACSGYAAAYKTQQCTANPLYATDCPGYAVAYKTQQCTANPLFATDCPGYAVAYKTQQCAASPLFATDCPGYDQAYLNSQCIQDSLYSTSCEGYKTAYAIKYLVGLSSAVTTAVNSSLTNIVETQRNDPANTTGTVDAVAAATSTSATSSTTQSATTSATSVSPVAIISTIKPQPPAPTQQMAQAEPKREERKEEGAKKNEPGPNGPGPSADNKPSDQPKSNREAVAERRREAAQKEAVAKGKDLANEMGKASNMEAQKAVQNVVIAAMGFTPGFDTYNKAMMPDTTFYKPFTVYGNQKNVDNQRVSRRLMGGSDRTHQEMVDSQFQLGK